MVLGSEVLATRNATKVCAKVGGQTLPEADLLEVVSVTPDDPHRQVESRETIGHGDRVGVECVECVALLMR